jgi:heterotetrameric sarcosine oxidase delta subunit
VDEISTEGSATPASLAMLRDVLLVPCPVCGPRNSSDLVYKGESVTRPDPNHVDEVEWRTYLYMRKNTAGWLKETWYCRNGCQRYFSLDRNTITNEFRNSPLPIKKT